MALEARVREESPHDIVFAACGQIWVKYEWRIARAGTEDDIANHIYLESRELAPPVEPSAEPTAQPEGPSVPLSEPSRANVDAGQGAPTEQQPNPGPAEPGPDLASMTNDQLLRVAGERGIAVKSGARKAEIIAAIQGA